MLEWVRQYRQKLAGVNQAAEGLMQHLRAMQDPQSAEDVATLLRFRLEAFGLDDDPATDAEQRRGAERVARFVGEIERKLTEVLHEFLRGIENTLSYDARHNRNGLADLNAIHRRFVVITGDKAMLTDRAGLPEGHPLRSIPEDSRSPWLELGATHVLYNALTGSTATGLPSWATVASIARRAEENRAERDRRQREEAEYARREAEAEERQRRLRMTQEELFQERLERVEKQLAGQK
jgi:hypothetical protein